MTTIVTKMLLDVGHSISGLLPTTFSNLSEHSIVCALSFALLQFFHTLIRVSAKLFKLTMIHLNHIKKPSNHISMTCRSPSTIPLTCL